MKRVKRDPEKFEVIDLFTALGRENGYKLAVPEDVNDFMRRVSRSLKVSLEDSRLIHGKRVESLFAHVAGALGECVFIKREDSGDAFSVNQNIQAPDYKIVLNSGEQFFIEVKNCNLTNFNSLYKFDKKYIEKLENYSKLQTTPLKFAIYFSRFNKWFLLTKESLIEQRKNYVTDFINSTAMNEMAVLGDRTIATEPELSIELLSDKNQSCDVNENGGTKFIIGDVKIYCSGREVTDKVEKSIAFYLIRFGNWVEQEYEAIILNDKFSGAKFTFIPESSSEGQNFEFIGELSSMISRAYSEHTVYERSVIAIDTKLDPLVFSVNIPEGYKGKNLPLWQFKMQPNPAFKRLTI